MGTDITPGHQYIDGDDVTGPSLTEHVADAVIRPEFIGLKPVRALALTDEFVVRDTAGNVFGKADIQALLNRVVTPGSVLQTINTEYLANTDLTNTIPIDDTIPQNTEGTEIITAVITPQYVTSKILVRFSGFFAASIAVTCAAALFKNASVSALAAIAVTETNANFAKIMCFEFMDSPSSLSAQTYRVRVGPGSAATIRMNGISTARYFGGAARTTLTVQEIKV